MFRAVLLFLTLTGAVDAAGPSAARLLRQPAISSERIVFVYAGDLWTAPRNGGAAQRLNKTPEAEATPRFSPDGKRIAFTRRGDVYLVSAEGGDERRLTWHPSPDSVAGWTPDGRNLLISSDRFRGSLTHSPHLFLLSVEGGLPEPLPIPRGTRGSYSPDGQRIAYGPNPEIVLRFPWKRYRGGAYGYIAIYDFARNSYEELPRSGVNDVCPMWHRNAIYFASDRDRVMNLYRYDLASKRTDKLTAYDEWDVKNPSLGPDAIVYENGGRLYTLDLESQAVREISVTLPEEALPGTEERAKWRQALDDAWRAYRDHSFHTVREWDSIKPRYEDLMNWAAHASDAEYVITEMLGETGQSHIILIPPARPDDKIGMLGADFRAEAGFYRITKIYRGEEANEKPLGPLAAPGLNISEGEFLIAVNGKRVHTTSEVYSAFEGLAGKEVKLSVSMTPSESGAWEITVTPGGGEAGLRYLEWERVNQERVAEATGGRVGYIHLTSVDEIDKFQKAWREQRNKVAAMIVDIRNNSGGGKADEILAWITRKPSRLMYDRHRRVPPWDHFLDGPKVLVANDHAVSGGDELPYLFKLAKAGPLVGNRTMGGMIGSGQPHKLTGGWVLHVPQYGFYWLETASWAPENYGVEPDYVVDLKPYPLTNGRDPQLEKAIELAVEALKTYRTIPDPPAYEPK